jgi:hypothetical protein
MKQDFPKVNVLLSIYEPGNFLSEQLISIRNQDISCHLYIRDDASSTAPNVTEIEPDKIKYLNLDKQNIGPKNSFFELLRCESDSDYVAFCDQDDIWLNNKLSIAIGLIGESETPTLYYSNAFLYKDQNISEQTNYRSCSFEKSIFENNAMGCTIVINRPAADLIKKYRGNDAIMHDWASLLIVTLHGRIIFDSRPTLLYRIHSNQTVGYRRKKTFHQIFNLRTIEKCVAQINEIADFYPTSLESKNYNHLLEILRLRRSNPIICYIKLFLYPNRLRRRMHHEIVIRLKFILLAIIPK